MDSDFRPSQPTQLLQHALAPAPQNEGDLDSPRDGHSNDFSLDSRVIPVRSVTPRYDVWAQSRPQSPSDSGGRVLVEDSQKEYRQKDGELVVLPDGDASGSALFLARNSISASVAKVIGSKPPSSQTTIGVRPLSRPTKSMHRHYHRSPSQDSFADPIPQDPTERYLASTKQFDVPLSDLGETPTQEVIHSPTDPGLTLPDASEHREFLEAAMRKYEEQRAANRLTAICHPNILVAASPSRSSGSPPHQRSDFAFHTDGPEFNDRESEFQFDGSSSFDKMLARGLDDLPDPTPESTHAEGIQPLQADSLVDVERTAQGDIVTTPPRSTRQCSPTPPIEWTAPSPSAAVAASDPRSLLRMVHPDNQYRIARMKYVAGKVEPRSCVSTGAETQPSHLEETQPYYATALTHSNAPPAPPIIHYTKTATRQSGRQRQVEGKEPEDLLDIVPDSEPLRAGPSFQTPTHDRVVTRSPLRKPFRPLSPMSEHGSGELVHDSLEAEGSEADIPLLVETAPKKSKPVAPTENAIAHSEKYPILERQPQRPPPSRATGRNSKVKPPKIESMEVPTSLPEQDLRDHAFSDRQLHTAVTSRPPSKTKKRVPENPEPSRAHIAIKSPHGNKRSRKSDTEDSEDFTRQPTEDETPIKGKMRKEEEEEAGSSDDRADSPPPPPPSKTDMSRKKRRRVEDVNPLRGLLKPSTSNRNKPSETPTIVTRSAKRLRSGMSSSVQKLATDSATRVFALWKQDGHYYSGVIYSRGLKNKHQIRFDDGTEDEVELKNMRRRELLVGDRVIVIQDSIKAVVSDVSLAESHGSFTVEADSGIQTLGFREIRIANRTIQSQWKERMVLAENIITVVRPKPLVDTTPSKQSVASTTSGKFQRELVKTGFVVTINPKNEEPGQTKEKAMRAIKQQGGLVIEDWSSVFTMEGRHSQANKRWIAVPQDFRLKSEVNLDRVFLLSDDAHQKPKFLLALALGIPCLSFEWLAREGKFSSDWQPFLLPAGYSDTLCARISQLVDLDWGNCTEHLTDIMESEVPIKLFSNKTVLCIGAELVPLPPSRARKNNGEEASRYVPWIILCMGATKVEAVADTKQMTLACMQTFDYIIVKERDILRSLKLGDKAVVGDVNWVKECLVSSRLSPPRFD